MTDAAFSAALFAGSIVAGFVGSLTGLGGGVVIVPLLTIGFGVNIRYAMGASLVSVIATSSGAAAAYVREGFSNIRVGMLLEIATTLGALAGAAMVSRVPTSKLAVLFGAVLLFSAFTPSHPADRTVVPANPSSIAAKLGLNGSYPTTKGPVSYTVHRVPLGFGIMSIAGALSGLLGIGSGAVKVLAMDLAMGLPFKVSTTTSNFMIGVTAAASAGIYLHRGYVDPGLAMPVTLGVLAGSLAGAKLLARTEVRLLRLLFHAAILALGVEMIYNGWKGKSEMPDQTTRDVRMEKGMGLLLRTGVLVSCAVMVIGGVLYLLRHGGERESLATFHAERAALESIRGVIGEAFSGTARGIIQLSVLILIATPVMRVIFAVFGFARERDFKFVAISLSVLALLAFGLFVRS